MAILAVTGILTGLALAGDVFERVHITIPSSGSKVWTNTYENAALRLMNVYVHSDVANIDTVTVRRVTSSSYSSIANSYTNTLGAAITAASNGVFVCTNSTFYYGLKYGDMLVFGTHTGMANTGAVVLAEFELQRH